MCEFGPCRGRLQFGHTTSRHSSFCVPLFCAVTGWTWGELLKRIASKGSFNAYRVRLGQNMV
jgi:hypothetical protein